MRTLRKLIFCADIYIRFDCTWMQNWRINTWCVLDAAASFTSFESHEKRWERANEMCVWCKFGLFYNNFCVCILQQTHKTKSYVCPTTYVLMFNNFEMLKRGVISGKFGSIGIILRTYDAYAHGKFYFKWTHASPFHKKEWQNALLAFEERSLLEHSNMLVNNMCIERMVCAAFCIA